MEFNLDWQKQALLDYQTSTLSHAQIAKKYGRSCDTIIKLVEREGAVRTQAPKASLTPMDEKQVISPLHRAIGVKLNLHRTVHNDYSLTEVAQQIRSDRYRVATMERGVHDFTLSELQAIAEFLGLTVVDLLTVRQAIYASPSSSTAKEVHG